MTTTDATRESGSITVSLTTDEIIAARDEGWGWPAIGRELGRSKAWVLGLVEWATNRTGSATPLAQR